MGISLAGNQANRQSRRPSQAPAISLNGSSFHTRSPVRRSIRGSCAKFRYVLVEEILDGHQGEDVTAPKTFVARHVDWPGEAAGWRVTSAKLPKVTAGARYLHLHTLRRLWKRLQ